MNTKANTVVRRNRPKTGACLTWRTTTRDAQEELEAIGVSGGDQERANVSTLWKSTIAEATNLDPELSEKRQAITTG